MCDIFKWIPRKYHEFYIRSIGRQTNGEVRRCCLRSCGPSAVPTSFCIQKVINFHLGLHQFHGVANEWMRKKYEWPLRTVNLYIRYLHWTCLLRGQCMAQWAWAYSNGFNVKIVSPVEIYIYNMARAFACSAPWIVMGRSVASVPPATVPELRIINMAFIRASSGKWEKTNRKYLFVQVSHPSIVSRSAERTLARRPERQPGLNIKFPKLISSLSANI